MEWKKAARYAPILVGWVKKRSGITGFVALVSAYMKNPRERTAVINEIKTCGELHDVPSEVHSKARRSKTVAEPIATMPTISRVLMASRKLFDGRDILRNKTVMIRQAKHIGRLIKKHCRPISASPSSQCSLAEVRANSPISS